MNTTSTPESRNDGVVASIGVLVLILGTATGSAYAMVAMGFAGLVMLAILDRQQFVRHAWLMGIAAIVGAVVAIAITRL